MIAIFRTKRALMGAQFRDTFNILSMFSSTLNETVKMHQWQSFCFKLQTFPTTEAPFCTLRQIVSWTVLLLFPRILPANFPESCSSSLPRRKAWSCSPSTCSCPTLYHISSKSFIMEISLNYLKNSSLIFYIIP